MGSKFIFWWIKGSSIFIIFSLIMLFAGQQPMYNTSNSEFVNWLAHFGIAISPIGAIAGFFTLWVISFIFDLLLSFIGINSKPITKLRKWSPQRISEPNVESMEPCPFNGRLIVPKDTKVLGFDWPSHSTAFIIKNDWSVATETNGDFGWIDKNGEIHKGRPLGGIDPKATLSGGNTGLKISGNACWEGNEKIGELVK